jgi:hypothetical protein
LTSESGCRGRGTIGNVDGKVSKYFTIFHQSGGISNLELKPGQKTKIYAYEGDTICVGTLGKPPNLDTCKKLPIPVDEPDPLGAFDPNS